jgi:hypothetical protein
MVSPTSDEGNQCLLSLNRVLFLSHDVAGRLLHSWFILSYRLVSSRSLYPLLPRNRKDLTELYSYSSFFRNIDTSSLLFELATIFSEDNFRFFSNPFTPGSLHRPVP